MMEHHHPLKMTTIVEQERVVVEMKVFHGARR